MISLNLKDGGTLKLDLSKDSDRARFNELGRSHSSSAKVTGIWFLNDDRPAVTLPYPSRFRRVFFYVEPLLEKDGTTLRGEIIKIVADEVCMTVTRYYRESAKMLRIDLKHSGGNDLGRITK